MNTKDLYLKDQPKQHQVFILIEERYVPYEFIERNIIGVFSSRKLALDYCDKNPLCRSKRHEEFEYDIEVHEVI